MSSTSTRFALLTVFRHWFSVQVYSIVDEMFLAGELRETSQTKVREDAMPVI